MRPGVYHWDWKTGTCAQQEEYRWCLSPEMKVMSSLVGEKDAEEDVEPAARMSNMVDTGPTQDR